MYSATGQPILITTLTFRPSEIGEAIQSSPEIGRRIEAASRRDADAPPTAQDSDCTKQVGQNLNSVVSALIHRGPDAHEVNDVGKQRKLNGGRAGYRWHARAAFDHRWHGRCGWCPLRPDLLA